MDFVNGGVMHFNVLLVGMCKIPYAELWYFRGPIADFRHHQ